jgi:hypothetical protein
MPLSTVCMMGSEKVTVSKALGLGRNQRRTLTCVECAKRVTPHKAAHDGSQEAHFEHFRRNKKCSRSDHRTD